MADHRDSNADLRLLLKTLRAVLKAKHYTYAKLAKRVGVSEVTVKRWLSGQACTVERLFAICDVIGVSFFDLAALAHKEEEEDHVLTNQQEAFFAAKPALFGLFKELYQGASPQELARGWKLTDQQLYKILRLFEKNGLLEVGANNRVRMKVRGNLRYSHRGPLAQAILRPQIVQFLDHVDDTLENDDVCMHSAEVELSATHLSELVDEIHALGAKYRARAWRDKNLLAAEKLKPVRWLLVLAPYRTNWRQYKL